MVPQIAEHVGPESWAGEEESQAGRASQGEGKEAAGEGEGRGKRLVGNQQGSCVYQHCSSFRWKTPTRSCVEKQTRMSPWTSCWNSLVSSLCQVIRGKCFNLALVLQLSFPRFQVFSPALCLQVNRAASPPQTPRSSQSSPPFRLVKGERSPSWAWWASKLPTSLPRRWSPMPSRLKLQPVQTAEEVKAILNVQLWLA